MRPILLATALLSACVTVPPASGPIALDETQRVGRFSVTPLELVEDSRCPMNARCIWAGRVVVRAAIDDGRARTERRLVLGEPAAPGIVLDSAEPNRMAGSEPTPAAAYRFHFSAAP